MPLPGMVTLGTAMAGEAGIRTFRMREADRRYLLMALVLLAAFMLAEVIVAVVSGSLALLSSLNVQGAFRHVLTDLYGFTGTVIAGGVILVTGYARADAIASLLQSLG